jgi:hypothetical protein
LHDQLFSASGGIESGAAKYTARMRKTLLGSLILAVFAGVVASGGARAGDPLQPDLVALDASELRVSWEHERKLLRFTTTSWNAGTGPFELVAKPQGQPANGDKVLVQQRIYEADGAFADVELSSMWFEWHAEDHNHWHLQGYAEYQLTAADGSDRATGQKTSFCIIDTDRINHRLPGAPKRAEYTRCGTDIQGMSVGWGDSYRYYLEGQSLDITELSDGQYQLTILIDPLHKFIEGDGGSTSAEDPNNTSTVTIEIVGDSVSIVQSGGGSEGTWCDDHLGHPQWGRRCS